MGITLAIFQISEKIPSSKDLFMKIHKGFETDLETPLSILWLIPSSPLALLGLRTSIVFFSFSCSVQIILDRELSVSLVKGFNWVFLSLTVEIEAK